MAQSDTQKRQKKENEAGNRIKEAGNRTCSDLTISVVMAVYNAPVFLEEQLHSLLKQSRAADEVIIVDDASADDTAKRVRTFIEEHGCSWKLVRNEINLGVVKTFRKGLMMAKGDLILLCDQDDCWKEKKIEVLEQKMADSKALCIASSFSPVDEKGRPLSMPDSFLKSNHGLIRKSCAKGALSALSFKDIAAYNCSPGCTLIIDRKLKDLYLSIENPLIHDWALCALASLKGGLMYLDLELTDYRLHADNTIGLDHRTLYEKRLEAAGIDSRQKEYLAGLVRDFIQSCLMQKSNQGAENEETDARRIEKSLENSLKYSLKVRDLYRKRAKALEAKAVFSFIGLAAGSLNVPFFYETLAMDVKSIIQNRS